MNTLEIKRGNTLDLDCVLQQDGQPVDITGWQLACWVRAPNNQVVHQFAVVITDGATGKYALRASADETALWPLGGLSADIRYEDTSGRVQTTRTIPVQVVEPITS